MDRRRLFPRRVSRDSSHSDEISNGNTVSNSRDRNELHFQPQDSWPASSSQPLASSTRPMATGTYIVPYTFDAPQPPPNVPERRGTTSSVSGVTRIARKPVGRSSISEGSSSRTPNGTAQSSSAALAQTSDMLLRSPSSTRDLFAQASNSLNNLASGVGTISNADSSQMPPPYSEPPGTPSHDVKRSRESMASSIAVKEDDIFQLIQENRIDAIQKMVEAGVGVEEVDHLTGRTALMEACNLRRAYICHIFLQTGTLRLHLRDHEQNTALHYAALQGDMEICRLLIDGGAQLLEYNKDGHTPIDLAARGGHSDATDCLLNCWTAQGGHASALLGGFLEAVKSCNVPTARAFIDRGVQLKRIKDAWKPVAFAAISGSIPMIDFLVAHRCNLKERSPKGWTALHQAAFHGHTAMVEKLLAFKLPWKGETKKDQETALHLSTRAGHTTTSLALIQHKDASVSVKDVDSNQPIHHAVRLGDSAVIAALLEKDSKQGQQMNGFGWNPMHIAAAYGHHLIVAEFVTRGWSTEDKLGHPDFKPAKKTHDAALKGYWAEIRWPHPGARPLHLAIEFGQDEVASMLIANGTKIDEPDSQSWRPLHYAAFNGRSAIVELLLERGASPHAITSDGNTALDLGFREPGLTISNAEKEHIAECLHTAMNARKKSKLRSLSELMSAGSNKSRDAGERNKAWHTAELAATLYLTETNDDFDAGSELRVVASRNSVITADRDDEAVSYVPPEASSPRIDK